MRLAAILLLTVSVAAGQNIVTKPLTVGSPIKIFLSPQLTTTLLFPGPLAGTFGLGLVSGNNAQAQRDAAGVQVEHPDGSNILVLHALSESSRVLMTVLLEGRLYVFDERHRDVGTWTARSVKHIKPALKQHGHQNPGGLA